MSINEIKCDQITESKLDLTGSNLEAFSQLRAELPEYEHITDYTLYRFLHHRSYDVAAAKTGFLDYMQWRKTKKLDKILDSKPEKIDIINRLTPYSYHGFDKDGRPVYIEKTGKIHCAAMADEAIIPADEFIMSHVWGLEHLMTKCHQSSLKLGHRVETFTSLLDMTGLGFHHRSALPLLKQCMDLDAKYYPELIGKLYVIHTPWVAPYLYQAATPFVPAEVRARVHVVNDLEMLKEMFDADQLPPEYGGSCTQCVKEGKASCVEEHDASEINKLVAAIDDGLEKQNVSTDFVRSLSCDSNGATFTWFFECEGGYDVDFSVEIVDDKGTRYAKIPSRCTTNRGSYEAPGKATLTFKWDNSFSWMMTKDIKYAIGVVKIDVKGADAIAGGFTASKAE